MSRALRIRPSSRPALGVASTLCAVAVVTGAVFALRGTAPVLSLGVLYLFAVLPVAVAFGTAYAVLAAVASMLAFNFFFLPPTHTFELRDSENWFALAVYLVTAVVVGELAARSRRRAAEAEQREREANLLAELSSLLLEAERIDDRLKDVAARTGEVLALRRPRIELGSVRKAEPGETAYDLRAGGRHVGRLFCAADDAASSRPRERVLPALGSLLATALERERLARTALEAEALRRSDSAKTAVLHAVSHDLRSPITAIRAAGEGLASDDLGLDDSGRAALLDTIGTEAARLERLVSNLIDLSRLEADAAQPRPEVWTAESLIGRALDTLGDRAERVAVALADAPAAVRADAAQVERILVNLIENALKFSDDGEPVAVAVEDTGDTVVIRVRDHGPGLAPDELERVLEPFQLGRTDSRGGTGLGLAIARGFAEANGGRISVAAAEGGGAVFTLELPRAPLPETLRT